MRLLVALPQAFDMPMQPRGEDPAVELFRVPTNGPWVEVARVEGAERLHEAVGRLGVEQDPRHPRDHGVQDAAPAECDHGPSRRHSLKGRDSEVLLTRQDQGAAVAIERRNLIVAHPSHKTNARTRDALEVA